MKPLLLIIDDDDKLNDLLFDYFSKFEFDVITAAHPHQGLKLLDARTPDLIVLDVMLPDMDGFEVCRAIRRTHDIPIIMLTARGDVTDRIVGLELGADDYLPKPFEPRELLARVKSVLRRSASGGRRQMTFGGLLIDLDRQIARIGREDVHLTSTEFSALALLARNRGKVLDRDTILEALRGMDCEAFNRSVDILMSRLRKKLGDSPKSPVFIKTVWGSGYVFLGGNQENGE